MKRMSKVLIVMLMALALVTTAKAQFGIYGGLALPMSDFGSTDANDKAGNAKSGFGGGLEFNVELPSILGWVTSLSVTYNDLDTKNLKEPGTSLDYTPWLAGWPMTGLRVDIPTLPIYAQAQVGACVAKFPDFTIKSGTSKQEYSSDPVAGFGFSGGAGVALGPLRVYGRYLHASDLEFELKLKGQSGSAKLKRTLDIFMVTAGIEF